MDEKLMKSRNILLGYLGGNEEKLDRYLSQLATCQKAYDVADRVIRPIYINEAIKKEDVCKRNFYGSILDYATAKYEKKFNADTLYYHIYTKVEKEWKNERKARQKQQVTEECMDTTIEVTPDGRISVRLTFPMDKLPESFMVLLKPYLEAGYAKLSQKEMKSFDARTMVSGYELSCPLLLAPDFLMLLKEYAGESPVIFQTKYNKQECSSIDEALEIVTVEIEESDE